MVFVNASVLSWLDHFNVAVTLVKAEDILSWLIDYTVPVALADHVAWRAGRIVEIHRRPRVVTWLAAMATTRQLVHLLK